MKARIWQIISYVRFTNSGWDQALRPYYNRTLRALMISMTILNFPNLDSVMMIMGPAVRDKSRQLKMVSVGLGLRMTPK